MFDREILNDIDLSEGECSLHECGLSVENPGDHLVLRPLCTDDYDKGKFVSFAKQILGGKNYRDKKATFRPFKGHYQAK